MRPARAAGRQENRVSAGHSRFAGNPVFDPLRDPRSGSGGPASGMHPASGCGQTGWPASLRARRFFAAIRDHRGMDDARAQSTAALTQVLPKDDLFQVDACAVGPVVCHHCAGLSKKCSFSSVTTWMPAKPPRSGMPANPQASGNPASGQAVVPGRLRLRGQVAIDETFRPVPTVIVLAPGADPQATAGREDAPELGQGAMRVGNRYPPCGLHPTAAGSTWLPWHYCTVIAMGRLRQHRGAGGQFFYNAPGRCHVGCRESFWPDGSNAQKTADQALPKRSAWYAAGREIGTPKAVLWLFHHVAKDLTVMQTPYWNSRAQYQYRYKNETFYTISPVPLYFYRRRRLLSLLEPLVAAPDAHSICDFGCGDGWYIQYFERRAPGKEWTGADISPGMLDQARPKSPNATFLLVREGTHIEFDKSFDLIYAIAVFAHVLDDARVTDLFSELASSLTDGGRLAIYEQTGPQRVLQERSCRRLSCDYVEFAVRSGLVVVQRHLIAFPAHLLFERKIAPWFYRHYARNEAEDFECRIRANHNVCFRFLSRLAVALSPKSVWPDDGRRWGGSFVVFRKPD
jgi:SAM-dependent methyltransferase